MSEKHPFMRDDSSGAILTDDREHRYRLWRTWDVSKPTVAFIMLNPSTADETENDPTIRRCIGFAKEWGYGRLEVGNLFAARCTNPDELCERDNPIGDSNDKHLQEICSEANRVIAAWGSHGGYLNRGKEVVDLLDVELEALNTTKEGHPNHPLYQPADTEPEPFTYD